MVQLELTERQAEYLNDILDMWIEGHNESVKQAQSLDMTWIYKEPEELLQTIDQLNWQHEDAVDLKLKLLQAQKGVSA